MWLLPLAIALTCAAAAARAVDDAWTSELPSVQAILDYYSEGDELDIAAQRYVAFETLHEGVQLMIGQRLYRNDWTPREKAALDTFREAKKSVHRVMSEKYRTADNARFQDYLQRRYDFRSDAAAQYDLVQRFAPVLAGVLNPHIAAQADQRGAMEARRLDRSVAAVLLVLFAGLFVLAFLYLLAASWRDKRVRNGVSVEEREGHTLITYQPGRHGPVAALAIYPLYLSVALFLATLSVGLVFLFVALENNEAFNAFMERHVPEFATILLYPSFWLGLGLLLLVAPWWLLAIANFRRRKPRKIAVNADAILVGSRTHLLDRLREFFVWGYGDGSAGASDGGTGFIVGGGNAAANAAVSGALHSAAIQESAGLFRRKVGRVSNQIVGEFGEQRYVLAKWLPWRRALILAEEIEKAIRRHRREA